MEETSLTFKTFKNISYNILGYLWPIIFTLLITPKIVLKLGIKEYGIYLFVTASLALLGLLDLGLSVAVNKHMSYYYGKDDHASIKRLAHSANSLFMIVGLTGFIIVSAVTLGSSHILGGKFEMYKQYSDLFFIGGIIFLVSTAYSTFYSILTTVQRFDILTKIAMGQVMLSSLSMFFIVQAGGSLEAVFIAQLIIICLLAVTLFFQAKKVMPFVQFRFGWDKNEIKNCYKFGIVTFVNNIASTALASLDRMIIPFYVGPSNLTYYSIPGNVGAKIPSLSNTLSTSIFPTVSQLSGSEEKERIQTLYIRSFRLITIIAAAFTITAISFAYKILYYWLNADFADHSSSILIILALTNFILALFGPLSNFLLGLGKLKVLTISSLGMAVLNAILLLFLLPRYGIVGAAYAYLFSVLPVLYFFYYIEKNHLNLVGRKRHYAKTIIGTVAVSLLVFVCNLFLSNLITSLFTLLLIGGVSVVLYILFYKLFGFFEDEDWDDIERFNFIVLRKIVPSPVRKIIKKIVYPLSRSSSYVKRKIKKFNNHFLSFPSKNNYSFAILCIKKTVYADMAIDNINSLHYFNPHHVITLYCDTTCFNYIQSKKRRFDYPENITVKDSYGKADKPWQEYKIDVHIQAAWNDQIDTDADEIWHESPVVDKKKITMLVKAYAIMENERDVLVIENVFQKKEWLHFNHNVAAFVSLPKEFMTEKIASDFKTFNDAIFYHPLDFIHDETLREDTRRLSEEFATNLAIQTNFPPEMITLLKEEDPHGSKKTLQSLYYGASNRIIE